MGGSVVVQTCPKLLEKKYKVTGAVVLDVVEGSPISCLNVMETHDINIGCLPLSTGSAIEALPHMHSLLNARPEGFDSVEDAIEWQ